MKILHFGGLWAVTLLTALILGAPVAPSHAAKPKAPPLPPVRFEIQYWDAPTLPGSPDVTINDMNNGGQIVGWYADADGEQRAYLYNPGQASAVDLEAVYGSAGVPADWKVASAVGINDQGVIVGYLTPAGSPYGGGGNRQGFLLDTGAETPAFVVLPDFGLGPDTYARQINENGDILGAYTNGDGSTGIYFYNPNDPASPYTLDDVQPTAHLNNPTPGHSAQVGGTSDDGAQSPFRWTPPQAGAGETLEIVDNITTVGGVRGINDAGTLCGSTRSGKPAKTYPFRLNASLQLLSNAYGTWGESINFEGDVLLAPAGTKVGGIYRDDWSAYGYYADINKLVVGTSNEMATWASATSLALYEMNDRGENLGGQIAGYLRLSNGAVLPFLLTPVTP